MPTPDAGTFHIEADAILLVRIVEESIPHCLQHKMSFKL